MTNTEPLLSVRDLEVVYGGSIVGLSSVSIDVMPGGFVAVLGPNGAGKTTLVRAITGLLFIHDAEVRYGSIHFDGQDATKVKGASVVARGIAQVPEGRKLFSHLTVEENLLLGASARKDTSEIAKDIGRSWERFPQLSEIKNKQAGFLSGGEQQMTSIARALMARPKLLICDELSLGLAPKIITDLFSLLDTINQEDGTAILLIEQNAVMAFEHATDVVIVESGRVVQSGRASVLREDGDIQRFYFGGSSGDDLYSEGRTQRRRRVVSL